MIRSPGNARLERYSLHDLPGVYRVCAEVDARGGNAAQRLDAPDLAGHVFAGPYLAHNPALGRIVADEHGVCGYIVGTTDAGAFERWRETHWYPALRERHPLPVHSSSSESRDDSRYLRFLHSPPRAFDDRLGEHPAELHIKLAPRAAGHGWGRALVEALIDELTAQEALGVHLHVAEENSRAITFYERQSFRTLHRQNGSRTMIRDLT